MFWFLDLCKAAAGTHYAYNKKENEQRKSDCLHRTVYIYDNIPYRAALKALWRLGNELPYLRQLLVPSFKSVLQALHNPVIRHSTTSLLIWITGAIPQSGSAPVTVSLVSICCSLSL